MIHENTVICLFGDFNVQTSNIDDIHVLFVIEDFLHKNKY